MTKLISTYTLPRPFYGYNIPIAIQSAYIRDYTARSGYHFRLPVTELTTSGSFVMLRRLLASVNEQIDELAVCSGFVFPVNDIALLTSICEGRTVDNLKFHLVLEAEIFDCKQLIAWATETHRLTVLRDSYSDLKSRYLRHT